MVNRLRLYPIVSRLAAAVLLLAGILKAHQLLTSSDTDVATWTTYVAAPLELLLGIWLLIGGAPRWGRLAAIGCFVVLFNVAFLRLFQDKPSCGCFGKAQVQTLAMVILDAVMVLALLVSSPLVGSSPESRPQWLRLTLGVLATLGLLGVMVWQLALVVNPRPARPPAAAARRVLLDPLDVPDATAEKAKTPLERVLEGVERNHAGLKSLEADLEVTVTTFPVPVAAAPGGQEKEKKAEGTRPSPRTHHLTMKTLQRGDDLRRDCETNLPDLDAREMRVDAGGKRIHYLPGLHQAWLTAASSFERGRAETIDLRCAGFHPPIRSIAEWLKGAELLHADVTDGKSGETVHLRMLAPGLGGERQIITLDCDAGKNYLPVRVVYRFQPAESVFSVTDLEYQKAEAAPVWLPRKWKYRSFTLGTTADADAATGFDLLAQTEVRLLSVNREMNEDAFDPSLPLHTRLVGNLASQAQTGDTPLRASAVMRTEPVRVVPPSSTDLTPWMWVLAGIDGAALGLCLLFRRDIAL